MSTTTIRIDQDLKSRVASAAKRSGSTAHAFMLEAISSSVERAEREHAFHKLADERWAELLANGKTVPWSAARSYLEARAARGKARKPAARKLER